MIYNSKSLLLVLQSNASLLEFFFLVSTAMQRGLEKRPHSVSRAYNIAREAIH